MKVASVANIKAKLSEYVNAAAKGPVVVTKNGKAVAVMLGVADDEELERLLLAHSRKLRTILDAAERRIREGAGLSHDDFWRKVKARTRKRAGREKAAATKV